MQNKISNILFILSAIGTFIIIPYMMFDISEHLNTCQELVDNIRRY